MFFFSREKPKIKLSTVKKDSFTGWLKCTYCMELIHAQELQNNLNCCPKCDYHYRLRAHERVAQIVNEHSFEPLFENIQPVDCLQFVDSMPYATRLKQAQAKTNLSDALLIGSASIGHQVCLVAAMEFEFMGGSMGSVVGEKLTLGIEMCIAKRWPLVVVATSGGARMQESCLSLMQMAKTASALALMSEHKLPYISILTNPTTGGVSASFAALGDLIIAEPRALICFAGPRVIEQTMRCSLPAGSQSSEQLLKHGLIDAIVCRHQLKNKLKQYLNYLYDTK